METTTTTTASNICNCDNSYYTKSCNLNFTSNDLLYNTTTTPNYIYTASPNTVTIDGTKILITNDLENAKEDNSKMTSKNFNMNFDFGAVTDPKIAISPFGIAVKNPEGNYCYYDPKKCEIVDCTPFTFDTKQFLFNMPVAISAIAEGDVIMHHQYPMFVKSVADSEGRIVAIDISEGEEKYILPTKNMFGFNFITKIVSFLDMKNNGADAENPFGNMLPFLMMMQDGKELDPMMLLMMSGSLTGSEMSLKNMNLPQNPLMMYLLLKDKKNMDNILPFLLMQSTICTTK